ncbi:hypothetical protein E4T43_01923 [Aureobasidium subglaciale]|nr:hypothetical protein E4T43_01923 [Aureobasidium subglaciale]
MYNHKELSKIEKWGTGLFENDTDIRIVRDFSHEPGVGGTTAMLLYPTDLLAQRERLDNGVANQIFKKHLPCDDVLDRTFIDNGTNRNARDFAAYKLCIFGAVLMRVDCQICHDIRRFLEKHHAVVGFSRNSQFQL